jgi:hypothetical protein
VDDIINGRNGWREIIANDQAFKQYRTQAKRQMQAASINLSQKALQQIENRIDKASAPQAAMVYGILRDKERLDAGEPTEIIALHTRKEIEGWMRLPPYWGRRCFRVVERSTSRRPAETQPKSQAEVCVIHDRCAQFYRIAPGTIYSR